MKDFKWKEEHMDKYKYKDKAINTCWSFIKL